MLQFLYSISAYIAVNKYVGATKTSDLVIIWDDITIKGLLSMRLTFWCENYYMKIITNWMYFGTTVFFCSINGHEGDTFLSPKD